MADNIKKDERIDGVRYITIPVRDNLDAAGIEDLVRQLAPPVVGIVGNYADVQRAGAEIVKGNATDFAAGVETPPGVTDDDIEVTRQVDAAVEAAVEGLGASSVGDAHTGDTGGTKASRKTTD